MNNFGLWNDGVHINSMYLYQYYHLCYYIDCDRNTENCFVWSDRLPFEMTKNGIVLFLRRCWKLFEIWNEQERREKKTSILIDLIDRFDFYFLNHLHKISDVVYVMYAHHIWNPVIKSDPLAWNRLVFI